MTTGSTLLQSPQATLCHQQTDIHHESYSSSIDVVKVKPSAVVPVGSVGPVVALNLMATPNIHGHSKNSTALLKDTITKELRRVMKTSWTTRWILERNALFPLIQMIGHLKLEFVASIFSYPRKSGLVRKRNHSRPIYPINGESWQESGCIQGTYSEHLIRCLHLSNRCFRFCKWLNLHRSIIF